MTLPPTQVFDYFCFYYNIFFLSAPPSCFPPKDFPYKNVLFVLSVTSWWWQWNETGLSAWMECTVLSSNSDSRSITAMGKFTAGFNGTHTVNAVPMKCQWNASNKAKGMLNNSSSSYIVIFFVVDAFGWMMEEGEWRWFKVIPDTIGISRFFAINIQFFFNIT